MRFRPIFHLLLPLALSSPAFAQKKAAAPAPDYLAEAAEAFYNYDFESASDLLDKYEKVLAKRPDEDGEYSMERLRRQLDIAENSLDNVQKVEIIRRIDVPVADFVAAIALPADGGRLLAKDQVPLKERYNDSDFVFATPYGDLRMWTETGPDGISHIFESSRLTDGSWEIPVAAGDVLNDGGSVRNPFMLSDGVTLYFASDGDGSMGGFDLFVASKDPSTGEYLQPTGVGYPFNSPFNEYLMAIDDENGIGWWVTDRNQLQDMVSVYVFKTNDVRKNYIRDDEDDIVALARVEDISITQNPDTDYEKLMEEIGRRAENSVLVDTDEGIGFHLPGGRVIRQLSDLSSAAAKRNMTLYLNAEAEYNSNVEKLSNLRRRYHQAGSSVSDSMKKQILEFEKTIEWQRDKLKKMRNAVISAELKR